ncbi:putative bola bacterial stress-induced morphogen protein [Trichostrongylus colubriformis]|uniref:Bola bacterial stress-induced morphogen protein n=1 Tax=Trichostrongylus colubriformis TaxID=6319 RepID=A0AAN8FLD7_TRICO
MLSVRSRLFYFTSRLSSTKTAAELRMTKLLKEKIDGVTHAEVTDVSSGCGSMYSVFVESSAFKGLSKVAQHKLVTGILKDEIRDMHGLSIKTKLPE